MLKALEVTGLKCESYALRKKSCDKVNGEKKRFKNEQVTEVLNFSQSVTRVGKSWDKKKHKKTREKVLKPQKLTEKQTRKFGIIFVL